MRAHIFQHVPFERPAAILNWLISENFEITYTLFYENAVIPDINKIDWLIIMGGPMSVNDGKEIPWLVEEKKFIKKCIESGKKVVGICLGSQLIASALGSKVYPGEHKEIGWFPINKSVENSLIPERITVFHWHGETFDLPAGAKLLASTEACHNQIFTKGNNVLGMQCHLEMTHEAVTGMLKYCSHEVQINLYVQPISTILMGIEKFSEQANQVLFSLLHSLKEQH